MTAVDWCWRDPLELNRKRLQGLPPKRGKPVLRARFDYVDEEKIAELKAALNRFDSLVVRRAMDALRNHPLRRSFRILSFATGAASSADLGVQIERAPDGNLIFRVTYSESPVGFELSGHHAQTSFNEVTLSAASMTWFAEALLDVLRQQGFHG